MLDNISHVYKGLILRNRAFASFKADELQLIQSDIKNYINTGDWIFDPMSGYGGSMLHFGAKGYKTYNVEINPPAYFWQVILNPTNKERFVDIIEILLNNNICLPSLSEQFSFSATLFTPQSLIHIDNLFSCLNAIIKDRTITISLLLPFVARFANYQRSSTNLTHFIEGGLCSFIGWKEDFFEYLTFLKKRIIETNLIESQHINHLSNIIDFVGNINKFDFLVTSPPYPNYRDYSKLFKIENWILKNQLSEHVADFQQMIGSNNIKGKKYGRIHSPHANAFLKLLLDKSTKLSAKQRSDIEVYYHPYFALYFYSIQEAYIKIASCLSSNAIGYIVVNDNITRDIQIPVGKVLCDIFEAMGFESLNFDETQISHFGNIGKSAKRINSQHTRHILKVWKK